MRNYHPWLQRREKSAPVIEILTDSAAVDSTVYGRCGEGTAMHTLELITDKGDTIVYTLEGLDTFSNVQGGLLSAIALPLSGSMLKA